MRAIRILKEADLVLAEDTRTSSVLLKHFDIKNRLVAHHKFNEHGTSSAIVERLKGGETIALISDAGTPGISADFAWTYGMHSSHRFIGFAMRPFLFRRIHSAEKGQTDLS